VYSSEAEKERSNETELLARAAKITDITPVAIMTSCSVNPRQPFL
jgi:hypothetical protein